MKENKDKGKKYSLSLRMMPLNYVCLMLIGLILFQRVPLPWRFVKAISPGTYTVYRKAFEKIPPFISLSLYCYGTEIDLYKILAYFGAFFIIINWADSRQKIQAVIKSFLFIGTFEAIYGIWGYLEVSSDIWWFKNIRNGVCATGTYINRNHLAGLLEIVIPLCFGLYIALVGKSKRQREKRNNTIGGIRGFLLSRNMDNPDCLKQVLMIFLTVLMMIGLFFSGSRGGIISLAVSLIFMNTLLLFRKKYRKYAAVWLIICSLFFLYAMKIGMDGTLQRFENVMEDCVIRMRIAKTALNSWKDFPVLGTGWGTFMEVYRKYKSPEDEIHEVNHAHQDWLELAVETGSVGFIIVIVSFIFCLGYFLTLWTRRKNSFSIGIGLGGIGAMVSLALHSLTDFNMHIPANPLLLSMAVGITCAALTNQTRRKKTGISGIHDDHAEEKKNTITLSYPAWLLWPLALVLPAGFCYLAVLAARPCLAEKIFPTLPDSTIGERHPPALEQICAAIQLEKGNPKYFFQLALSLENIRDKGVHDKDIHDNGIHDKEESAGTIEEGSAVEEELAHRQKTGLARIQHILGEVKVNEGKRGTALLNELISLALQKAIHLNPTNPYYHEKLGWHIMQSVNLSENWDQIPFLTAAAEKEFERALYFMPGSANIHFSAGCYFLLKTKVVEDEEEYLQAFNHFIYYFQKTYQIDPRYRGQIQQMVQQYYPSDAVFATIFSPPDHS
ncbi:MAG: O-antigen ligase family protein [bacterium]